MDLQRVLADVETLVKMCHSKNDGASLIVEEEEVETKISDIQAEIDEIKVAMEEDSYDTSAEMADRNIEIILKKLIQSLTSELKTKKADLASLCEDEHILNEKLELLKQNKKNCENYIATAEERLTGNNNSPVSARYTSQIEITRNNLVSLNKEVEDESKGYNDLQAEIEKISKEVNDIEAKIESKTTQLAETQANLENKDYYVNTSKKSKSERKIKELESRKQKLEERLSAIKTDPKYLEIKIRRKLSTSDDTYEAKNYVNTLIEQAKKVPFLERDADANLEEELLKATQARDEFASAIGAKTYNLLENISPSQIRVDFLKSKIEIWKKEIADLEVKASTIDNDALFNYNEKSQTLNNMINEKKADIEKYTESLNNEDDEANRTTLKVLLDDTKKDLNETERIYNAFKVDETNDIKEANMIMKNQIVDLENKIKAAEEEINDTYTRLQASSNGLIDVTAQNKDKEQLKELAQVVVNIKHRRQFAEKPSQIADRLLKNIDLLSTNSSLHIENPIASFETPETPINTTNEANIINDSIPGIVEEQMPVVEEQFAPDQVVVPEQQAEIVSEQPVEMVNEVPMENSVIEELPETLEASPSEMLEDNVEEQTAPLLAA